MPMSAMTRRLAMQFLGGGVATVPTMAKAAAPDLIAKVSAVAPLIPAPDTGMIASRAVARFGKLLGSQIDDWQSNAEAEKWINASVRVNGIDPDIAAMKSWSATYRARKQIQRNAETDAFLLAMQRLVWR